MADTASLSPTASPSGVAQTLCLPILFAVFQAPPSPDLSPTVMILILMKMRVGVRAVRKLGSWKDGKLERWEVAKLRSWEAAKLGSWDAAKLGSWKVAKLGSWDAAMLGSWKVVKPVGWDVGRVEG